MVIKIANGNGGSGNDTQQSPTESLITFDWQTSKTTDQSFQQAINATKMDTETNKPPMNKPVKLQNLVNGEFTLDTLHQKAISQPNSESNQLMCPVESVCYGSLMKQTKQFLPLSNEGNTKQILAEAKHFFEQYFASLKQQNTNVHCERIQQIELELNQTGTYEFSAEELLFGAKLAWRNAARCIGRIQWQKLQLFDVRNANTARQMFDAICNHIRYATNGGNLRSTITVFPQRIKGRQDFRLWNPQLIAYAGYETDTDSPQTNEREQKCPIRGDPVNVEFTKICQKLGWKGSGSRWDILPIVISIPGQDPEWFSIPEELVLRIPIMHPKFPWFEQLDLQWYALPAVSSMQFAIGGIEFPACPFSGWYMSTEVAVRDLSDVQRLNILPLVAHKMGLDTSTNVSLWKDRAVLEVNTAVLHSYQRANVTIVDQYTAAETFMQHLQNENRSRGGCPADWVWIVPPISGSLTPVFHQEMLNYDLKPAYVYQTPAWKTHQWNDQKNRDLFNPVSQRRLTKFRTVARLVRLMTALYVKSLRKRIKATILFASETGKSEQFARRLSLLFAHAFNVSVMCMDEYTANERLEKESLLVIVTSTFGNGDAPENGVSFAKSLLSGGLKFEGKYAVFGLGSSAYPHFCAFGKHIDSTLEDLGAQRLLQCGTGDELNGQERSFGDWATQAFDESCDAFGLVRSNRVNFLRQTSLLNNIWSKENVKLEENTGQTDQSTRIESILSKQSHNKKIIPYKLIERTLLTGEGIGASDEEEEQTLKVTLKTDLMDVDGIHFAPGDHLALYPPNEPTLVNGIIDRLLAHNSVDTIDQCYSIKVRDSSTDIWRADNRLLDSLTVREALHRCLDLSTSPTQQLLRIFVECCEANEADSHQLRKLCDDPSEYEQWKAEFCPNLLQCLQQFPSVRLSPELVLTQLPLLQPRYYSISSSPLTLDSSQIDLTVAVVKYRSPSGELHRGLCSNYLANIAPGRSVFGFVRTASNFHLPKDVQSPVIMVGPGTGIAPFRSFWQHRSALKKQTKSQSNFGPMSLFFGCRTAAFQLYRGEVLHSVEEKTITNYHVAYSRKPGKAKRYVQDEMKDQSEHIFDSLVRQDGHLYVCGDVTMAEGVNQALKQILLKHNIEDVDKFMQQLKESNRYHEDIFGNTRKMVATQNAQRKNNKVALESKKKNLFRFWKFC